MMDGQGEWTRTAVDSAVSVRSLAVVRHILGAPRVARLRERPRWDVLAGALPCGREVGAAALHGVGWVAVDERWQTRACVHGDLLRWIIISRLDLDRISEAQKGWCC